MSGSNGSIHGGRDHANGSFEFRLNGEPVRVAGVSPNTTLLDFLRARDGCRGTKEGCAEGDCGACSVALVERDARGRPVYRAINSCLALLPMVAGREVVTVEGVRQHAPPAPRTAPTATRHHGHTPTPPGPSRGSAPGPARHGGTVRLAMRLLHAGLHRVDVRGLRPRRPARTLADLRRALRQPVPLHRLPAHRRRHGRRALPPRPARRPAPGSPPPTRPRSTTRPAATVSSSPATLDELLALRARHPAATLIAGATELGLEVNKKFYRFETLICRLRRAGTPARRTHRRRLAVSARRPR